MLLMQVIRLPLKPEAREAIRQRMKAVHARAAAAKEPPPARKEPPEPKFTRAQEQASEDGCSDETGRRAARPGVGREVSGSGDPPGLSKIVLSPPRSASPACELAEACLAHAVGNATVQAYQRSTCWRGARLLMESWANTQGGSRRVRL